ncbi:lytic murein transglycosylase [bacterium]|nr:lytic murein transglycosylase [bacterium]MBU1652534.1 lytic murein transglycosylase [bacterium]MBU1882266.1 lytic murein transglycosylase [bacterium]
MTLKHLLLCSAAVLLFSVNAATCKSVNPDFASLTQRLISDGQDSNLVLTLFGSEQVVFIPSLLPRNLLPSDALANYQGFLAESQIQDGLNFLRTHSDQLTPIVNRTKIPLEIVIAMLKIESDLGRNPGSHPVLSTLATLSSMNDTKYWEPIADTSKTASAEKVRKRAFRRSEWAYKELVVFLDVCRRFGWSPLEVKGSWAGAFGWAQFLPSSYMRCARDGDGDMMIDPYTLPDAVASLLCYLEEARWGETTKSQRKALHLYNPSTSYVDSVMEYAERLKSLSHESHP